jgi:SulP family sulfate permease
MIVLASTARFKLATLVQYVPLPVVGGYLGYVGYFCLAAGIGLGTNTTIDTFTSWTALASQGGSLQGDSDCLDALGSAIVNCSALCCMSPPC